MKLALKVRLIALAVAIVALVLTSIWSVYTGWREVAGLNAGLRIAEHVDTAIVALKGELIRAELAADPAQWQRYLQGSRALADWIEEQKPLLKKKHEGELIDRIGADYAPYLANATSFVAQLGGDPLADAEQRRVFELLDQLAEVRRRGPGQLLADSHRYIATLQKVNLTLLATTAVFAVWLTVTTYRRVLVPLHRQIADVSAALEQSEKLASLGVLASGVAHEIRNPLTAIKARLYTHQKALPAGTPEHADCDFIGEEITRLERIVRDFLQFARPSEPHFAAVSPEALLRELQELLAPELHKSSVALVLDGTVATAVEADAQQIKQVLINLVRNAAESIGKNGKVTLRARESRLAKDGRRAVALEIEDTGGGIPPDVQKRLFDPFFTTKPSGTGLGLSIAARIVGKHGGALEFETQAGRGTTFRVMLTVETTA
jgi:signal transduction histidine kinase